ncbi:MAG: hypothetical protein AAFN41_01530 [Planctomycetota bacterium]
MLDQITRPARHLLAGAVLAAAAPAAAQCTLASSSESISFEDFDSASFTGVAIQSITQAPGRLYAVIRGEDPGTGASISTLATFTLDTTLTLIGSTPPGPTTTLTDSSGPLAAVGNLLVALDNPTGDLVVYDMTTPATPVSISGLDLASPIRVIESVPGGVLALTNDTLFAVSLADPFNPVVASSLPSGFPSNVPFGIVKDGVVPVSDSNTTSLIDVSNLSNITSIGSVPSAGTGRPAIVSNRLVITDRVSSDGGQFVEVWDITDPANPTQGGTLTFNALAGNNFLLGGIGSGFVYYAATELGAQPRAIDVTDALNPVLLDSAGIFNTESRFRGIALSGDLLLAGGRLIVRGYRLTGCATPPQVLSGPFSQATTEGGSAITLQTTTTRATSFQWKKDGQNIADGGGFAGATTETLTVPANASAAGIYTLDASNPEDSTTSQQAFVVVRPDPNAVDCPADQNFDGMLSPADFNAWVLNYNTGC